MDPPDHSVSIIYDASGIENLAKTVVELRIVVRVGYGFFLFFHR